MKEVQGDGTAREARARQGGGGGAGGNGGRSPTGVAPGGAVADDAAGSLEPGQRWTVTRKREVVLRVMRGESVEALSREFGLESYRIQDWHERAMAGVEAALRERNGGDPLELQLKRAQSNGSPARGEAWSEAEADRRGASGPHPGRPGDVAVQGRGPSQGLGAPFESCVECASRASGSCASYARTSCSRRIACRRPRRKSTTGRS